MFSKVVKYERPWAMKFCHNCGAKLPEQYFPRCSRCGQPRPEIDEDLVSEEYTDATLCRDVLIMRDEDAIRIFIAKDPPGGKHLPNQVLADIRNVLARANLSFDQREPSDAYLLVIPIHNYISSVWVDALDYGCMIYDKTADVEVMIVMTLLDGTKAIYREPDYYRGANYFSSVCYICFVSRGPASIKERKRKRI